MNGNNDSCAELKRSPSRQIACSRRPAGTKSASASASGPVALSSSLGNGTSSSPRQTNVTNDSSSASASHSGGLNSFLKWFKKSPSADRRPHSQPPPQTSPLSSPRSVGHNSETRLPNNRSSISLPTCNGGGLGADSCDSDINCTPDTLSPASSSPSLSLSSLGSSRGSVYSTATNGFAFISPEQYVPYGTVFQPEKRISVGPVTDTYRQRLTAQQRAKDADRQAHLRLSQKYNLIESDATSNFDASTLTGRSSNHQQNYCDRSLPAATDTRSTPQHPFPAGRRPSQHRRTRSDSSKDRRAGAYVHVKGKRKAPEPPLASPPPSTTPVNTLARRKRQAPAPPTPNPSTVPTSPISPPSTPSGGSCAFSDAEIQAIMAGNTTGVMSHSDSGALLSTDTLKLEHGQLKHTDNLSLSPPLTPLSPLALTQSTTAVTSVTTADASTSPLSPISPRPWYKRSSANNRDQSIPFKREITLKTMEKRKHKSKVNGTHSETSKSPEAVHTRSPSLFDGFMARVTSGSRHSSNADVSTGQPEKRRSAIGMPNISELDREAGEIIRMEELAAAQLLKAKADAMAHDKYFEFPVAEVLENNGTTEEPKTPSTRELISRFEETNPIRLHLAGDKAIVTRYFADATAAPTTPVTTTPVINVAASASASQSSPSSPSSSSTMSAANNASARNRALSPTRPSLPSRPARTSQAADAPSSMMQCIFSNNNSSSSSSNDGCNAAASENVVAEASVKTTATTTTTTTTETSEPKRVAKNTAIKTAVAAKLSTSTTTAIACSAATDISEIPAPTQSATWICTYCTLENYNWRVVCEVCERMRPYQATKPEAAVGPNGQLIPLPRFPANGQCKDVEAVSQPAQTKQKPQLIDSSAVVTTTAQVFVAPLPARHDEIVATITADPISNQPNSPPNLAEIRAARIEKFSRELPVLPKVLPVREASPAQAREAAIKPTEKPMHPLSDRGSLEREKQRLRDMIREMNAKALAEKYPVNIQPARSSPASTSMPTVAAPITVSDPVPIPVGLGAVRKQPQARKIESPEDKIISDTTNYVFNDANNKTTATKASQASFERSMSSPIRRQQPTTQLNLPSPIAELAASIGDEPLPSGATTPTTSDQIDEQIDSIYAKLRTNNRSDAAASSSQQTITRGLDDFKAKPRRATDTLALNKLLKNLELAIGEGEHELAAKLAMDLARMKVSLSVTKQPLAKPAESDVKINNGGGEGASASPADGWICPLCTLINDPERPGCVACSETRPTAHSAVVQIPNKCSVLEPVRLRPPSSDSNDLNKTSMNRRSAEIFNIVIGKEKPAAVEIAKGPPQNAINSTNLTPLQPPSSIVMTATVETTASSPNITRTKYRGVDNYNPQVVNKKMPTSAARKSAIPYRSPLARTNALASAGSGVKITAVRLKTGENIAVAEMSKVSAALPLTKASTSLHNELLHLDNRSLVANRLAFECPICFGPIASGAGVVLRDCLHSFCRECLAQTVRYSEEAEVRCPFINETYSCESCIQEREIRALLSRTEYERHLAVSLSVAELRESRAFHCRTPGCRGWCIYEDNVNEFRCPICRITNCLTCRVVHDGLNCKQYQDRMNSESGGNAEEARRTSEALAEMIEKGEAIKCPVCQVILMKKWGCDWLKCSMCKTEICWVMRCVRWGPEGKGDTSAGCRCGVDGVKCHPKCNYCH